jgi:hypothetical protein
MEDHMATIRILALSLALGLLGCKGDSTMPHSGEDDFVPPPRTSVNTWDAGAPEEALIGKFLAKFPPARAAKYREILKRTDAILEMPDNPAAQMLLDEIYAERRRAQELDSHPRNFRPTDG